MEYKMTVAVVGLGLIGGSYAKAYKRHDGIRVLGLDLNKQITQFAILSGDVDEELTKENVAGVDLLLIATYPAAAEVFLQEWAADIDSHTVVIDSLGTKREICEIGFALAKKHGFTFFGGHPMAGTHNSGFKYAREDLFDGAPMVIVPPRSDDIALLERVKVLLAPAGFATYSFTTAKKHDEMIAYTSQLAHVVSNAYIKSKTAGEHRGFSAGSYRDLTRVAWLNPQMWAELFLENGDNLIRELNELIDHLTEYKSAIEDKDEERLIQLLDDGRRRKKEIDGVDR